jgi:hypothetical protein
MQTPKSRYSYFTSLEKTITLAIAIYGTILLLVNITFTGVLQRLFEVLQVNQYITDIFYAICTAGIFYGIFVAARKIKWISKVNAWLDGKFFGLLGKSNLIIFQTLLSRLDDESQQTASTLPQQKKEIIAQSIFEQLSGEDTIFLSLLNSGIFRLWIWYWIMIYGTVVSIFITLELFSATILGLAVHAKMFFTVSWLLAFLHLACGIFIGYYLIRMTRSAAMSIVESHGNEIAEMLKKRMVELQE